MNSPGSIIGLTGGIATGKSTVADIFSDLGVVVLDADILAREIVAPGQPAFIDIVDTFGHKVVDGDGTLNRTRLGEIIFRDGEARKTLEAITHPRIARAMFDGAKEAFDAGHDWIIYDAALLVETGTHHMLDALIVVHCSPKTQLQRLLERDDITEDEARRRIDAQMPLDEKRQAAHFVIDNDGSLSDTHRQVQELKERIDELIAVHGTATPRGDHNG
jgi:dephospho-CoA kinase